MAIDIFNIKPSVISRDLKGKYILIYGKEKSGKTTAAASFPKALLCAFERGYNGIGGVMAADFGEVMHSMELDPYESWQGAPINNVIALWDEVYSKGNEYDGVTLITDSIKINLKEEYIKFFDTELPSTDSLIKSYKAYVVNTAMYNWVKQNG